MILLLKEMQLMNLLIGIITYNYCKQRTSNEEVRIQQKWKRIVKCLDNSLSNTYAIDCKLFWARRFKIPVSLSQKLVSIILKILHLINTQAER